MKKYSLIYADPPWNGLGWNTGRGGPSGKKCPARHYSVQTADWICSLPVESITEENCALFLWATYPNLPLACRVVEAWGFRYATVAFTWIKQTKHDKWVIGCGHYTRANPEIVLLGMKGSLKPRSHSVRNLLIEKIGKHSQKPARVRQDILTLFGDLPRCELFARQVVEGWDCWGNEVESTIAL